jgi:hypothetical protein
VAGNVGKFLSEIKFRIKDAKVQKVCSYFVRAHAAEKEPSAELFFEYARFLLRCEVGSVFHSLLTSVHVHVWQCVSDVCGGVCMCACYVCVCMHNDALTLPHRRLAPFTHLHTHTHLHTPTHTLSLFPLPLQNRCQWRRRATTWRRCSWIRSTWRLRPRTCVRWFVFRVRWTWTSSWR